MTILIIISRHLKTCPLYVHPQDVHLAAFPGWQRIGFWHDAVCFLISLHNRRPFRPTARHRHALHQSACTVRSDIHASGDIYPLMQESPLACGRCSTCLDPIYERFRDYLGLSIGFRPYLSQPRRIQSRDHCRPSHRSCSLAMESAPRWNKMASEKHSYQPEQRTGILEPCSVFVETANNDNVRISCFGHHDFWTISGLGPGESSERNVIPAWGFVIGGYRLPDHWDCLILAQHRAH